MFGLKCKFFYFDFDVEGSWIVFVWGNSVYMNAWKCHLKVTHLQNRYTK